MTLLALMYHQASAGRHGNSVEMLEEHFALLARACHCVLPGERLEARSLNVCLTFDDGYVDFYASVFPLLKKHGLRAVLAVPISVMHERAEAPMAARLEACSARGSERQARGGHCTWGELAEMAATKSIAVAAHGFTHRRLDQADADLQTEIAAPQTILAARTGQAIESFVLPYGRFSAPALAYAKRHYHYVFRIGSADNAGWNGRILYRVDADEMQSPGSLLSRRRLATYRLRRHWNALRTR